MIIYVDPVAAPRMTRSDTWKKRSCVMRYFAFRDEIRKRIKDLPVPLRVHFGVAMPDSWSQKKKLLMLGQPHTQKPDIDNFLKALLDSVFDDDAHVHEVHASKSWAEKGFIIIDAIE